VEAEARAAAPLAATALVTALYLAVAPATADLAAHDYRAWLFDTEGFAIWNANWYGGHHVPAYSVLFPPLGGLLGPRLAGALAAVAAVGVAAPLLRRAAETERRGDLAVLLFAAGVLASLWIGRMPFVLGVAVGAAAWAAAARADRARQQAGPLGLTRWRAGAAALALACGLASPLTGLFLAMLAVARRDLWLVVPAVGGPLLLTLLFPEGGHERFVATAFWPMFGLSLAGALLLGGRLRVVAALNVALLAAAFVIDTAIGQNAMRLAATLGPAALALGARPVRPALVVGAALLYLQWLPAVRAVAEADGDPSVQATFHEEAARYLEPRLKPGERVEVVFTRNHWEASHLAKRFPLARGWERQLDVKVNPLFYDGRLTPGRYLRWLAESGVSYVALADVPLDYSGRKERELLLSSWPAPEHASARWRIWKVPARARASLAKGDLQGFATASAGPTGQRWSRYWSVTAGRGCVRRGPRGETLVTGPVTVRAKLRPTRCVPPSSR
jgi:hypothetical protein